jgi:hypothetical protein
MAFAPRNGAQDRGLLKTHDPDGFRGPRDGFPSAAKGAGYYPLINS